MKKTHGKYILKSIKQDLTRLIAIFIIVMLGIGFLVGLMSTPKDLRVSTNRYYQNSNFMDIYIQSTVGFDDSDVDFLKENIEGVKSVQGYDQEDKYVYLNDTRIQGRVIYRTFEDSDIDKITLVEGDFPTNNQECVMLDSKDSMVDYEIGSYVNIDENEYKVVGKVKDPFYIANQPEQTIIGNGILDGVIYLDKNYFENLTVKMIKMTFIDSANYITFNNEYKDFINKKIDQIQNFTAERLEVRKEGLREDIRDAVRAAMEKEIRNQIVAAIPSLADSELLESIMEYVLSTDMFKNGVEEQTDKQISELFNSSNAKWYVLSRSEVPSYYMISIDVDKINAIANIFPVFFFLIALLVSVSSVTRIVQNDRQQIGTLRSLGYSKGMIYSKYVIYGLISTLLGAIVGTALGTFILPFVITQIYRTLYDIPVLVFTFDYQTVLIYSALMLVLILGSISIIAFSCLREHVSNLLTGKAPVAGKKILLEKIPFIWKHLRFKEKSMLRNVFRFKKNLIMMLIGIGGCTAILLTSFGLRDSLSVIQTEQYGKILKYDMIVTVDDVNNNPLQSSMESAPIYYLNGKVLDKDENIPISLISGNEIDKFVGFTNSELFNEKSVIVTKQIADELNLEVGENIVLDFENETHFKQLRITGITENYINNYIYMGEKAFLSYFDNLNKNAFIVRSGLNEKELKSYMRELLLKENVVAINSTSDMKSTYENILNNLGAIVVILVLLSGALIAVVIYNLTDIIICERIKEIATLRVTGYFRREALGYIFKEIIFMSIIGILIGLGLGVGFHRYVMMNIVSIGLTFGLTINPLSYLYTILLAIGFISLTAVFFYPKIKNIQMAEALKSVE